MRRVVEAVPFYGPPAAAALDVGKDAARDVARSGNKGKRPVRKKRPPPKDKSGEGGKEPEPVPEDKTQQDPSETSTPEKKTMIMSEDTAAKAADGDELKQIVAGLAEKDPDIGEAMAPTPPPPDYVVRRPDGKAQISQSKYRRYRRRFLEYQRELAAYNSARAFDKQIERQKQEIREKIRRAKSRQDVEALKGELRQVETMGKLGGKPRLFMHVNQDARLNAIVRTVLAGQRPQVTDGRAFEALIQGFLTLAQRPAPAEAPVAAEPLPNAPAVTAAPLMAPPAVAMQVNRGLVMPGLPPGTPFMVTQAPMMAPMMAPMQAPAMMPPALVPQAPAMMPPPPVAPEPPAPPPAPPAPAAPPPVAPSNAEPFTAPPGQPSDTITVQTRAEREWIDPRLGPIEDESGLDALMDEGYGVLDLEGACECGGTCAKCRLETGCASCAVGDGDDLLEGDDDDDDDLLEGDDEGDLLEGDDEGDLLEGDDEGDLLEGDEDDLLEGDDEDLLEGDDDDDLLEGDDEGDLLEGDDDDDLLEGDDDDDLLEGDDDFDGDE